MREMVSRNEAETQKLARDLVQTDQGRIFGLVGELGAGKTTFVQAFLAALGAAGPFTSPSFLIMKRYPLAGGRYVNAFHIDCYRLATAAELLALNFNKIISDGRNVVLIEWADKVKNLLPPETIWLTFHHGQQAKERLIQW